MRLHDMGGRFGDGAVIPDTPDAPVFKHGWHARALALTLAAGSLGRWNLDTSRHARERLSPMDYSRFSYYACKLTAANVAPTLKRGGPTTRSGPAARFAVGDAVRLKRARHAQIAGGHTRLPAYMSGATGTVLRCHGCHVFPDANAHGAGEQPQPLYTIAVKARDIWLTPEHPDDEVTLDAFEPYLDALT